MKRSLLASVSVLALTLNATAADLPRPVPVKAPAVVAPAWSWTGFYVGINGGGVWHRARAEATELGGTHNSTVKATGATFGGQAGFNWQVERFVLGIEADWNWVDASGTAGFPGFAPNFTFSSKLSSLATVRGRLGVTLSPTMIYATGGFAAGKVSNSVPVFNLGYPTDDKIKTGWTAGGGIEHMLTRNWTVKAEALYVDLGKSSVPGNGGPGYVSRFTNTAVVARGGVNFKW
ncbi:MAG TPA: outer membrane beta-barrel protein [Xanthobacteraceae bacterium]|nr:outer membrane beta-barrel protein [Xanthobacteraceae bacterium]